MNIFQLNNFLLEFNEISNLTSLTADGNIASRKNLDNITLGLTTPNVTKTSKLTQNDKMFPNLSKLVKQMKKDSIKGNKIVVGAALKELQQLLQTMTLNVDENNQPILPFGKDVRLTKNGNNYFVRLKDVAEKENELNITKAF